VLRADPALGLRSLLAAYPEHSCFLPGERELLEVYARYAASAVDGASALLEAESRYGAVQRPA
jgi:hypothetical protein